MRRQTRRGNDNREAERAKGGSNIAVRRPEQTHGDSKPAAALRLPHRAKANLGAVQPLEVTSGPRRGPLMNIQEPRPPRGPPGAAAGISSTTDAHNPVAQKRLYLLAIASSGASWSLQSWTDVHRFIEVGQSALRFRGLCTVWRINFSLSPEPAALSQARMSQIGSARLEVADWNNDAMM